MILVILPEKYLKVAFIPVSKARLEIEADTCLNDIYHAKEELHNAATDNNVATDNAQQGQPADSQAQKNQAETQNAADTSTALQPEADSTPAETQYVTITVMDGEVCRDIAADLQSKGLVDDAEKFRIYMGETGYASFIHNGDFQIPVGASYEEIANILLRK